MKSDLKKLLLLFFFFFFLGIFLSTSLYHRIKAEFVSNNAILVENLLSQHPELEREIVKILKEPMDKSAGKSILEKYGLTSLDSLEYLKSFQNFKLTFFLTCFTFFILFVLVILVYFFFLSKKRKDGILKIDHYLFSLLSEEISVDLKDFQSGELETLQNDLMKVTSRLKHALEHSTSSSRELSKTLADISHQLKTPLTSLAIINEALANPSMDEKTRLEFLGRQEYVIQHMQTLVINLLKVSQIESGMIELKKERIQLSYIVENILEDLELLIVSKNIEVKVAGAKDILIVGDFLWTKEAILNIIKNAIEYSYDKGVIEITATDNPMFTELTIKDYGSGISKEALPHIFERFYKTSTEKESVGIGLNLSKSIFDRMNATVKVKSKEKEYTIFTIHFYKSVI